MSRDGPQASRDKLARIFALLPEHCLLHVGHDLEDDAKYVERPADVFLKIRRLVDPRTFRLIGIKRSLPGGPGEDFLSVH